MIYRMTRALYFGYLHGDTHQPSMTHAQIIEYINHGLCVEVTDVIYH